MDGMDERVQIRRRLGRGLNALLGDDLAATDMPVSTSSGKPTDPQGELRQMPVNAIERNPYQPRTEFESSTLRELSDSIQQHGVLQPLLVRALPNGGWQLIAGERRLIAAKQAGLATVPCRVLQLEEQQVCEVALEENLKRKDLNVLEKAQAFANYLQQFGRTIEELSKQLSLDRSTVSNLLRLLDLAEPVKDSLRADKISGGHARALLSLPADKQEILCQRIESESLSVRDGSRCARAARRIENRSRNRRLRSATQDEAHRNSACLVLAGTTSRSAGCPGRNQAARQRVRSDLDHIRLERRLRACFEFCDELPDTRDVPRETAR